jgi:hypothetical protein
MRLMTPPLPAESRPVVLHPVLQLHQFALQAKQLLEIKVAIDLRLPAIGGLCELELAELMILELKLQLLVQAVAEVGADQFAYGVVGFGVHLVPRRSFHRQIPCGI